MNNVFFVQVADAKDDLSDIELDVALNKSLFDRHNIRKVATSYEWHDKVQPQTGLEKVNQAAEERMVCLE